MTTTKQGRTPGRPRQFDAEQAIETAQRLFHARGYDAVSVADLTPGWTCPAWMTHPLIQCFIVLLYL